MSDEREKALDAWWSPDGRVFYNADARIGYRAGYDAGRASRDVGVEKQHERKLEPDAALTEALGRVEQLERELARERSAAEQYRERLNVSEAALAKERGLTQSLGARCKELHVAAHRAALFWESTQNYSLHQIRIGMRRLREVLNRPNSPRLQLLQLAVDVADCVADECDHDAANYDGSDGTVLALQQYIAAKETSNV